MPSSNQLTRLLSILTGALLLAGVACTSGSGDGTLRIEPPPEAATTSTGTNGSHPADSIMSAADLRVAYEAVLQRYVDPVDHTHLLGVMRDVASSALVRQAPLPFFTLTLDLAQQSDPDPEQAWRSFGTGYDALVEKLPQWAAETHLDWTVLRAMTGALDDSHSIFLTPEDVARRAETSFVGIGVLLSRSDSGDGPLVAEVFPNSPAQAAGLRRGDRLIQVDGAPLKGQSIPDVAQLIRGPRGTAVRLTVRRASTGRTTDVSIDRAPVQVDPVTGGIATSNGSIGYLRIRSFTEDSTARALRLLDTGRQRGARAWILDLRGNSGGSLQALLGVAGALMPAGTVVGYELNRQGNREELTAQGDASYADAPLVVLVDRDTTSGAEILAAALKESDRATVVGTRTAGSVGVATLVPLADGSAIQVTEKRFVTPSGAPLDRVGLEPDQEVALTEADLESGRDPQLQRAAEIVAQNASTPALVLGY